MACFLFISLELDEKACVGINRTMRKLREGEGTFLVADRQRYYCVVRVSPSIKT